jgi:DNA-binding response OmpR family regulator
VVNDDEQSCDLISHALAGYSLEFVHDGVSALARLISHRPDLVILDVDLPVVDGFKVLEHIRSSLSVPIIVVSGSRVRSSDRVLASELGADCFLTKPLSASELSHRAELLIARHRGTATRAQSAKPLAAVDVPESVNEPAEDARFTRYEDFAIEVERRVQAAMTGGAPFSVVGCRLHAMTARGGRVALQLFEIVRELARDTDLTTTNTRNDLVMLLPDATASGARAFAARLRTSVVEQTSEEPTFWIRSFPESALAAHASGGAIAAHEIKHLRRASDHKSPDGGLDSSTDESSRSSAAGAGTLP